jgi:hypothetical protein
MARYFYIDEFYADARGSEQEFPQYCLIEPDFMGYEQNDAHPPHDIMRAEKLIADVYNTIRANDALWHSTLLVVMFDEHGGFYDHVRPPKAVPPDNAQPSEYTFDQLGIRVPAILVSPWVEPRVEHTQFDHTSVLKYLTIKWNLGPLGRRTESANSIGVALASVQQQNALTRIALSHDQLNPPDPLAEEEAFGSVSSHQQALSQLAAWLEMEAVEGAPKIASWTARIAITAKVMVERLLAWSLDEPKGFSVSTAKPDKISLPTEAAASNRVVSFLMRQKRYAAVGIQTRLADETLPKEQQQHSLQTLVLLSGCSFHRENDAKRLDNARTWLTKHRS